MRTLRLSIRVDQDTSVAELANLFGDYFTFWGWDTPTKYIQFEFKHIKMLTGHSIRGIIRALEGYESKKPVAFKMFHLWDDDKKSHGPVYLLWDGDATDKWRVINSEGVVLNKAKDLLTLI